jgi:hypothetical protein
MKRPVFDRTSVATKAPVVHLKLRVFIQSILLTALLLTAFTTALAAADERRSPASDTVPNSQPASQSPQLEAVSGQDRLIIDGLGIDAPIRTTDCNLPIPDGIWYWPCAGKNNFYLTGHDWGVFHPLQVAYREGRLTPGMVALYSDHDAVIHRYLLLWVEDLPLATFGTGAVWAATPGAVITLQTCDGPTDDYRIIVRFVPA